MLEADQATGAPVVLLVEDNLADVVLTREAFAQAQPQVELHHVNNGEECMAFLRHQDGFAGSPTPDLVLLDLNMPVMNGREVMAEVAADHVLRRLPVILLTTSRDVRDVLSLYELRCNSVVPKPIDFARFQDLIQDIVNYWFRLAVLPPKI